MAFENRVAAKIKTESGLTLQIGDPADDVNQMKVVIGNMHTDALGIHSLSVAYKESAAAEIMEYTKNNILVPSAESYTRGAS